MPRVSRISATPSWSQSAILDARQRNVPFKKRPTRFVLPTIYPSTGRPCYPIKDWHSIFGCDIYEYLSTIISDRYTRKRNSNVIGRVIYIHMDYLNQLFIQQKCNTPEVYSNTGGQASKASNIGQVAQFAAAGKETKKKSLSEIAMSYGYVYVAQVAMGANPMQTLKAIAEAEAYDGPSLIIGYSPCEMHSIAKGGMMHAQEEMKKAVDCGYWNLFRFNPNAGDGNKFILDSKEPQGGYREFLMNEARYSRLTREFPERAEELFAGNERAAMERYEHLLKLKEMYSAL